MIIDISKPESDFNSHLSLPSNERILFSGGFGTGKTYFLNEFFNSTNRNCEALHLYPVNYSVASNEDIFELIKFDIIIELFKKQITLKKISFDKFLTAQFFTQNKIYDIVNILIENTVKVSKSLVPVASVIIDLKKKTDEFRVEFENFHKECQTDEEKLLLKHLEAFANQKGTIYEEDSITLLIRELIDQLKLAQKEVILIVDDLDRIDPEHIFRLLNVFSAHYDSKNTSNKFGFDKVILVCDIDNIRNIFHAKYGANVDFSGYIDKFYSKEIFKFDNSEMIRKNIKDILESVNVDYDRDNDEDYLDFSDTSKAISLDLVYILEGLIKVNALKIRSLAKLSNIDYPIEPYSISYRGKKMWNTETPICIILNFLKFLFGNETGLKLALQKCCDLEPLDIQDPDDIDDYSGLN